MEMHLKSSTTLRLAEALAALFLLVSCGGSSTPPPPPPALSITTATLPDWMVTFAYSQTFAISEQGLVTRSLHRFRSDSARWYQLIIGLSATWPCLLY